MCGICAVNGYFKGNGKLFKELLIDNEPRGLEATGMIWKSPKNDEYKTHKAPVRVTEYLAKYMDLPDFSETDVLVGHTRNSTAGNPEDNRENHPHIYKNWIVVHNGVIDNVDELYHKCRIVKKLRCDSAVIPIVFNKFGFEKGLSLLGGWFSIVAVNSHAPGKIYLAKNDTSYATLYGARLRDDVVIFSSKRELLTKHSHDVWGLKDNTWAIYKDGIQISKGSFECKQSRRLKFENARTIGYSGSVLFTDDVNPNTTAVDDFFSEEDDDEDDENYDYIKDRKERRVDFSRVFKRKSNVQDNMIEYGD